MISAAVLAVVIVAAVGCGGSSASFPEGTYARTLPPAGVTTRGPKPHHLEGGYWRITIQGDQGWITAPTNERLLTFSVSASGNVSGGLGTTGNLTVGAAARCIDQKQPTKGSYDFTFYGPTLFTLTPVSDSCHERLAILTGDWTKQQVPSQQGSATPEQGSSTQRQPSKPKPSLSIPAGTYARWLPNAGVSTKGPKPHRLLGGYWRITFQGGRGWITAGNNTQLMIFSARVSRGRLTVGPVPSCADQSKPSKGIYELRTYDARHFGLRPVSDSCYDRLAIMPGKWAKQGP